MEWSTTDREVAVAAARAGAAVLRTMFGTALDQTRKTATDFATAADHAAEAAILDAIRVARPDDGLIGEESGTHGADGDRVWLVDPLCGTLNYAAGTTTYAVNVALRVGGSVTAAAVGHPPTGAVWSTDGTGLHGLHPSARPAPTRLVDINADGPLDRSFVGAQLAADPDLRSRYSPRIESTTLALAWVATGHRLGYVTDGTHVDSVHFAAGLALCAAAGCIVTDFDGRPVHSGAGVVAAADPGTHQDLLRLVARYR